MHFIKQILAISTLALTFTACGPPGPPERDIPDSICTSGNDLSQVPDAYLKGIIKYTLVNSESLVFVCTQDTDGDGAPEFIVIETTNEPEHESVYFDDTSHEHYEDYDYQTNAYKYDDVYTDQRLASAGPNKIVAQRIIMKIPIAPKEAASKTATSLGTIGIALNGVSFFNEQAGPGDEITEELFTFDQCSGHPQQQGVYHYHVDPVCLIRDLGGEVAAAAENLKKNIDIS